MVKPIPARNPTPATCDHFTSAGKTREPQRHRNSARADNADRFADDQPGGNAQRQRVDQGIESKAGQRHTGIGEREYRHHAERDIGQKTVLQRLQGRAALRIRIGTAIATTTPASVACTPDFSTNTHNTTPTST